MTAPALLAFLHHLAAFVVFAALTVELVLMKQPLTVATARSLLRMDAVYGISAVLLIVIGFVRVFHTEKGSDYYFQSGPFIAKIALFAVVGLLSIYPTLQFLAWRKALQQENVPVLDERRRRNVRIVVHTELTLLALIMLCAALMARGIGFIN